MKEEARNQRQRDILDAALAQLIETGFAGTTMQAVARRAGASMETLYNWYGDKAGLFRAMVMANIEHLRNQLETRLNDPAGPEAVLATFGPRLLEVLTSERVVALNRAAVADSSGELGRIIASAGRQSIAPLVAGAFAEAARAGVLRPPDPQEAAEIYLGLLIGDLQIRRVVARMPPPDAAEIERRANRALRICLSLWAVAADRPDDPAQSRPCG